MRTSVQTIAARKAEGRPIVMVTAYDAPSARIAERAGVDMILVGDSLGMVVLGHETTLPVTLEDMVRHTAAVTRASETVLVVADLPFLTYAEPADAVRAAGRLMQEGGAQAVKLEGGRAVAPAVRRLVDLGVPVVGHLGYTPQSTLQIGVRMQAKDAAGAEALLEDALALEGAGAFAVVLELVPDAAAAAVTQRLRIPTIGIGAGPGCDGQVQVWHDLLGLYGGKTPRHARRYADLGAAAETALRDYVREVGARAFPPPRGD